MKKGKILLLIFFFSAISIYSLQAQSIKEILDAAYQQTLQQESLMDSLGMYSYIQRIHFSKMDGDGEVEEQSKREFLVRVKKKDILDRQLISAYNYEEDEWINVSDKEKENKQKKESSSQEFSLTEMVAPERRDEYKFEFVGEEQIDEKITLHLYVEPLEKDEEKFSGDLWFSDSDYGLIKAILIPSDTPTGVKSMTMEFNMVRFQEVWLPAKIIFNAEISFLFIFKGKIESEIVFDDYRFDQTFPDSLFKTN